tara:strand:+ start:9634 stop:9855 length:222 start_codon:yes stop_codon:yes gene_type:complete
MKRNILFKKPQQIVAFNRTLIEKSAVVVPATRGAHLGLPLQRCRNTKTDYILGQTISADLGPFPSPVSRERKE